MPALPIVEVPDPRLRLVSEPVAQVDDDVRRLAADMLDSMYAAQGIGLAAIQVGVPRRLVVLDLQEPEEEGGESVRRPQVLINPEVTWESEELNRYNEGCLSIPEQYAEVERPARVRARWLDGEGASQEAELDGLLATVVQHEIDHLNGVLFTDHLSRLKRDMLYKKLNKLRRAA